MPRTVNWQEFEPSLGFAGTKMATFVLEAPLLAFSAETPQPQLPFLGPNPNDTEIRNCRSAKFSPFPAGSPGTEGTPGETSEEKQGLKVKEVNEGLREVNGRSMGGQWEVNEGLRVSAAGAWACCRRGSPARISASWSQLTPTAEPVDRIE